MPRSTHSSSANFAVCGNRLLISRPLWPCFLKGNGLCIRWPIGRPLEPTGVLALVGVAIILRQSRLGIERVHLAGSAVHEQENDVLCPGREMRHALIRGGSPRKRWGGSVRARKPSRDSRSSSASPAKPAPACQRNSRRDRPHGVGLAMKRSRAMIYLKSCERTTQSAYTNSLRLSSTRHASFIASKRAGSPSGSV